MKYVVTLKNRTYEVEVEEGQAQILDEYEALAPAAGHSAPVSHDSASGGPSTVNPSTHNVSSGTPITSPLPGNVISIPVIQGQEVKEGDVVVIIEAMKMENEVVAPSAGTVEQILVSTGDMVAAGETLLVI